MQSRSAVLSRLCNNNVKHLEVGGSAQPLSDPGEGLPTRIISMAMHAQLRLQADFNWASLTPAEAAALPWYSTQFALKPIHYWRTGGSGASTQYKYGVEPPVGAREVKQVQPDRLGHIYAEFAGLGLDSFASMF